MGYQSDREGFVMEFAKHFPKVGQDFAKAFLREASGAQRYNEITTSIDVGQAERERLEKADERRTARLVKMAASIGAKLEEGGDPRGCPFSIITPSGREIRVPGRGLPARCFR